MVIKAIDILSVVPIKMIVMIVMFMQGKYENNYPY